MSDNVQHDELDDALRRCGSSWDAAQSHGLLASRLAIEGADGGFDWLQQVLGETSSGNALVAECQTLLNLLYQSTYRALSERLSDFSLLLPDDEENPERRATALAHWCEGFLHGLVSSRHAETLKERLAAEPMVDIIKDMLQMTRASFDEDENAEESEAAYNELVEYARVAAQLAYEELADLRDAPDAGEPYLH
ncbi:MAG: UPF0149 family protein [Pseudomonadota bacterium]